MEKITSDASLYNVLAANSYLRSKFFGWDDKANQFWQFLGCD